MSELLAAAPQEEELLEAFRQKRHDLHVWQSSIRDYLAEHPHLYIGGRRVVHSVKFRLKDERHLRDKIRRKFSGGNPVSLTDLFTSITDMAGVRILHIFQQDFQKIDEVIRSKISDGDWYLAEQPKAYTWDPEAVEFFEKFPVEVIRKDSAYTSVHYLIRPRADSPLCCELQVRTLFEEIWGEVDHLINYPHATEIVALREQLKVLSKVTGAGSRLLDAIGRVMEN